MRNLIGLELPEYTFGTQHTAMIIGAGLAGCAIANALANRGYSCNLYDHHPDVASLTSALPVATIRPTSTGCEQHTSYLDHAFDFCTNSLPPSLFNRCGALQLIDPPDNSARLNKNAVLYDAVEASKCAGTEIKQEAHYSAQAGWVQPVGLCKHWTSNNAIKFHGNADIATLRTTQFGWQLISKNNHVIDESALLILATAEGTTNFSQVKHLPLQQVSGQLDKFDCKSNPLKTIVSNRGYLLPDSASVWSGSSHHRQTSRSPVNGNGGTVLKSTDSQANHSNIATLAPQLNTTPDSRGSFTGVRTYAPDRLPVVGAIPDAKRYRNDYRDLKHGKPAHHFRPPVFHRGLYVATAYGSRGAMQAPFNAELISSLIRGQYAEYENFLQSLHPARFLQRSLRKGCSSNA